MAESLQSIREVKKKYEREWLDLPGVAGVGLGVAADGQPVIIVSVENRPELIREKIPEQVEGVAVEIRESGTFQAL